MNTFPPDGVLLNVQQFVQGNVHVIAVKLLAEQGIQVLLLLTCQLSGCQFTKTGFIFLVQTEGKMNYASLDGGSKGLNTMISIEC